MTGKELHVIISGDVQGVLFRSAAKKQAGKLNLTGWIQNNPDGTVEAVFQGSERKLKTMLNFCYHGPDTASVDKVDSQWREIKEPFSEFEIR